MKILFAVSNENVSDAIVKSYQKNYNDTVTYKNVFYFNAIVKEVQRDRTYDRIIVSEDLEPFANNNYEAIDKFIYERLDNISTEINDFSDKRIPIILVCTDRRTKSSSMIKKLFSIGIYDAIIGSDRKIDNVCKLISEPRSKEDAQAYYKIQADENEQNSLEDVSEEEVQNILSYYKKLGKNEERYTDSFNNIASQYTDAQLKIIIRYLPINVRAVLETECEKYQELVTYANETEEEKAEKEKIKQKRLKQQQEEEERIREEAEKRKKQEEKMAKAQEKQENAYVPNSEVTINQPVQNQGQATSRAVNRGDTMGIGLLERKLNNQGVQGNVVIPNAINTKNVRRALSDDEMNTVSSKTINREMNATPVQTAEAGIQSVEKTDIPATVAPVVNSEEPKATTSVESVTSLPGFEEVEEQVGETVQNTASSVAEKTVEDVSTSLPGFEDLDQVVEKIDMPDPSQYVSVDTNVAMPEPENVERIENAVPVPEVQEEVNVKPEAEQEVESQKQVEENIEEPVKRGRGRPRKTPVGEVKPKGKRGRPRKNPLPEEETEVATEIVAEESKDIQESQAVQEVQKIQQTQEPQEVEEVQETMLPGFETESASNDFSSFDTFEKPEGQDSETVIDNEMSNVTSLPGFDDEDEKEDDEFDNINVSKENESAVLPGFENDLSSSDFNSFDSFEKPEGQNSERVIDNQISSEEQVEQTASLPGFEDQVEDDLENIELSSSITKNPVNDFETADNDLQSISGFDEPEEKEETKEEFVAPVAREESTLPGFDDSIEPQEPVRSTVSTATSFRNSDNDRRNGIRKLDEKAVYSTGSLESVLTRDKKVVAFIGTSKNGTSFIVNNLASLFSSIGVKTAILDMTRNRNAYYIYTNNDENLRQISYDAIDKLENGVCEGIKADRNLDVFTAVPSEEKDFSNAEAILTTLVKNESLVLIDCDYDTPFGYFANAQEIYLVQSMDILTIQPLTAFLRELKANGILDPEKLRVIVNKEIKVRGLTSKTIIGGMSFYNDPSMSYMTELFDKNKIKACTLPFEDSTYSKYLETLVNCNVSISGYSKNFMNSLKILGNMVYPLLSKQTYVKTGPDYTKSNNFSDEMNNTLDQMRKKY